MSQTGMEDKATIATEAKVNIDQDAGSNKSYKSSSSELKYQSSSAESLGRQESEKEEGAISKSSSRSRTKSPSPSRSRDYYYDRKSRADYRSHRPYKNFRRFDRDNFTDSRERQYKSRHHYRNEYNSGDHYGERKHYDRSSSTRHEFRGEEKYEYDEKGRCLEKRKAPTAESGKNSMPKISDIKNIAQQATKSFLTMLEENEKKKFVPFVSNPIVQPTALKKIPVKIHTFVNTFNSINNNETASQNDETSTPKLKNDDDSSNDSYRKKKQDSQNLNSSREEGELKSDVEKKPKHKKVKKDESSSSEEEPKKKSKKNKKLKKRKKKRHSSSSSSASSTSSSSSSTASSSSDSSSSSESSSSSSESDSSDSSSSSDSSRAHKKKSKKKRKDKKAKKKSKKLKRKAKKATAKSKKASRKSDEKKSRHSSESEKEKPAWPEHLIAFTQCEPSIQFSLNPSQAEELISELNFSVSSGAEPRKPSMQELLKQIRNKNSDSDHSTTTTTETRSRLSFVGKMKGHNKKNRKNVLAPIKTDLNYDYHFYYQYYYDDCVPHFENDEQAQAYAYYRSYYQMFNSYDYTQQDLSNWAKQQGFSLLETSKCCQSSKVPEDSSMASQENKPDCQKIEVISTNKISSSVSSDFLKFELNSRIVNGNANSGQESSGQHSPPLSPPPPRPQMTFLDLTQPKTLPNGVVLPPGTKQIIVHPYSRPIY